MVRDRTIVFVVKYIPDIDQIIPIIHKLTEEIDIPVDILIHNGPISDEDYRIQYIKNHDQVSVHHYCDIRNEAGGIIENKKKYGKKLPTDFPKRAWQWYWSTQSTGEDRLSMQFGEDVVGFFSTGAIELVVVPFYTSQWPISLGNALLDQDISMIAVSHGDVPMSNRLKTMSSIKPLLGESAFEQHIDECQRIYNNENKTTIYDAVTVPNDMQAKRYQKRISDTPIKILGSPRYNKEWIEILSSISPEVTTDESVTRIFFFP
jgi:hypothetical protein